MADFFTPITQLQVDEIVNRFVDGEQTYEDEETLVLYIIQDFAKQGKIEFTAEEVQDEITGLILDKCLEDLSKADLIETSVDENGKFLFKATDKGLDYLNSHN